MASTSSRTLRLLSLLQTHRYWSGVELAERLEVSLRTLRRDVDRLRDLGYPVRADRGVGGGYQLAPGASLPPLLLDDEEAVALAVGLLAGAGGSLAGIAEASVRALAKVVQVMPPSLRRRVEALRSATASPQWPAGLPEADPVALIVLAQACRDDERVSFGYRAADGTATDRRVEPAQLVSVGRRWYLLGYDLTRGDWRVFRLDRIQQPTGAGARFRQRTVPGGDPAAYVRRRLDRTDESRTVTAVIRADAGAVRHLLGRWVRVTDLDDGCARLEMEATGLEWAALALGVSGAEIVGVEPPELGDLLAEWASRFSRLGSLQSAKNGS
ncbi:YafY family protein [Microlunatus sp. Gsoil 973]|uniref:helix-turn-helix transcriptional regulator n=1 Tax=Microlunatus sp. Gsoil 973 TaxID=2672569 RepID=UPI0012B44C82|nr:YafY family protein [Microlunatus sp. Gsoil 973]QGN31968.1 WYL domain-containing protein [Microlunatus sp. Gsoil 973]